MKTPAQIADETATEFDNLPASGDELMQLIAKAIEADREQRSGRLEDLHAYDHFHMDEDEGREERILIVQIDTEPGMGRARVYINDGRIYDGDPETGQEWSLT